MKYYKLTFPNGFDFQTGNSINYRNNIGKIVKPVKKSKEYEICTDSVLHASENLFDAMSYARLPCAIFVVEGEPVVKQSDKCAFARLKVIREIPTTYWHAAYCDFMIWMLQENKNFVGKEQTQVLQAIDGVIQVFINAKSEGFFSESATESAWSAVEYVESVTRSVAWAAESAARSVARAAARSAHRLKLQNKFVELLELQR